LDEITPQEIERIREDARVSQPVFARFLNTNESTVQKWKAATKRPSSVILAPRRGRGASAIIGPSNFSHGVVFEATGIHDWGQHFSDRAALSIPDTVVRRGYRAPRAAIEAAMVGTQLLGVRFVTFMRFLPLLLLLHAVRVGTADRLTERTSSEGAFPATRCHTRAKSRARCRLPGLSMHSS